MLLLVSGPARGDHDEETRTSDGTPYALRPGEVRLGLYKAEWTPPGSTGQHVLLGSYLWPWISFLFDAPSANGYLKVEWYRGERWSWATALGLFYLRLGDRAEAVRLNVFPLEVTGAYRLTKAVTFAAQVLHTQAKLSGQFDSEAESFFRGAVIGSNGQLVPSLLWRWSERTMLIVHGRFLLYQRLDGAASVKVAVDERTTAEVAAQGALSDLRRASTFGVGVLWSWHYVNLKLGFTAGQYSVPGLNLMLPSDAVLPDLDLYVRF
jgi:hypothetical protein